MLLEMYFSAIGFIEQKKPTDRHTKAHIILSRSDDLPKLISDWNFTMNHGCTEQDCSFDLSGNGRITYKFSRRGIDYSIKSRIGELDLCLPEDGRSLTLECVSKINCISASYLDKNTVLQEKRTFRINIPLEGDYDYRDRVCDMFYKIRKLGTGQ